VYVMFMELYINCSCFLYCTSQIVQCMDVLQKRYYSEINVDVLEYEIFSHLLENK